MLRLYKYAGLILLLGLLLTTVWPSISQTYERWFQAANSQARMDMNLENAHTNIIYQLDNQDWLEFPVTMANQQIKIISNMGMPTVALSDQGKWSYALDYQVLSREGEIIQAKTYHHRTRITRYRNKHSGQLKPRSHLLDSALNITDGRKLLVTISRPAQAATFRLRLHSVQAEASEVFVRAYSLTQIAERKLTALWQRLDQQQKQLLTKNSIYPPRLLTEDEKRNLLRYQWEPVGPSGIQNRDYFSTVLYSFNDLEPLQSHAVVLPTGLELDSAHDGLISIPEPGGQVRLTFQWVDGPTASTNETLIDLHWYGRSTSERLTKRIPVSLAERFDYTDWMQSGKLLIQSPHHLIVRAFIQGTGGAQEITPEPLYSRSYGLGEVVDFSIAANSNQATPIQIAVRRLFQKTTHPAKPAQPIRYQLFDAHMTELKQGDLPIPSTISRLDRVRSKDLNDQVSDPLRYHLLLTNSVAWLRIHTTPSVVVNVYNRPTQLPKTVHLSTSIPTAHKTASTAGLLPNWFLLPPVHAQELLLQQHSILIAGQKKPPQDSAEVSSKDYLWQNLVPTQQPTAHTIFTPETEQKVERELSLGARYCELPIGQNLSLALNAHGHLRTLQPRLVYLRKKATPFVLKVWADDKLLHHRPHQSKHSLMHLPALSVGLHRLRFEANADTRILLNHIADCPGQSYLKRTVYALDQQGLNFIYTKQTADKETLLARFYTDQGNHESSQIGLTIHGNQQRTYNQVTSGWTFMRRIFDLAPTSTAPAYRLYSREHELNTGQLFFINLDIDLPPGEYRLNFTLKQGSEGLLSLGSQQYGKTQPYWVYKEAIIGLSSL